MATTTFRKLQDRLTKKLTVECSKLNDSDVDDMANGSKTLVLFNTCSNNVGMKRNLGNEYDVDTFESSLVENPKDYTKTLFAVLVPVATLMSVLLAYVTELPLKDVVLLASLCLLILFLMIPNTKFQTRVLKWDIDDIGRKITPGLISSPNFNAYRSQCRILLKRKSCAGIGMEKYAIGIILTRISHSTKWLSMRMTFQVTGPNGEDLIPELKTNCLSSIFEFDGDCHFSEYLSMDPTKICSGIQIKARVEILRCHFGPIKNVLDMFRPSYKLATIQKGPRLVFEVGTVTPEHKTEKDMDADAAAEFLQIPIPQNFSTSSSQEEIFSAFHCHPETKIFIWNVKNAESFLVNSNLETNDIFSPSFILYSNGVCSIWRMKLVKIQALIRLHLQLRGVPTKISQLKIRFGVQIQDTFGDYVSPEESLMSIKYPDYLGLWDTTRLPLYSSEIFCDRFIGPHFITDLKEEEKVTETYVSTTVRKSELNLKISIQTYPVETGDIYQD